MQEDDHAYRKRGSKLHPGSKKKGCSAAIILREIILFPEYKVYLC